MAIALAIKDALSQVSGWDAVDGRQAIAKSYVFRDFSTAWGFMTQAALKAEAMDHHPEWRNVYRTVDVVLTTHDAGGVTEKDIALAQVMDAIASTMGAGER